MPTLYRCSQCGGVFSSVFPPLNLCRACKTGDKTASAPGVVTIVEPDENQKSSAVAVNPQVGKAEFFSVPAGESKTIFTIPPGGTFITRMFGESQGFMNNSSENITATVKDGRVFFSRPVIAATRGRVEVLDMMPIDPNDWLPAQDSGATERLPEAPLSIEKDVNPHAAMLKPSRKIRVGK